MSFYGSLVNENSNTISIESLDESINICLEEIQQFSNVISLNESIELITEANIKQFISSAFKKIKEVFNNLLDKIKTLIKKVFKVNFKIKDKKKEENEDNKDEKSSEILHTTNRIYFVYNDKEYGPTPNDLDNVLSDYISDEGVNQLSNLLLKFNLAMSKDVDKLKEQFDDIKSKYNSQKDITIREKLVENISQSEFDKLDKEFDQCQEVLKGYLQDLSQVCKNCLKRIDELESKCKTMNDSIVENKSLITLEIQVFEEQASRCTFLYKYYSMMLTNYRKYGANPFSDN